MQKIIPHLWFDTQALAAVNFYCSFFPNSQILQKSTLPDTPSGEATLLSFQLNGYQLMAINAGPDFQLNPSISFTLNFDPAQNPQARQQHDHFWQKLSEGGQVLMPLDRYPFSEHYGWVQDKFGVSWQLILTKPEGEPRPFFIPSLLFTQQAAGKAEAALRYYLSVFPDSQLGQLVHYGENQTANPANHVMFADFQLANQWFMAMDSALDHQFHFNEALSLLIECQDQSEIDYYWEKLSAVPAAEQCGWLKDQFGISWQVSARSLQQMLSEGNPEQIARVTQAFLPMKKLDLAKLQAVYDSAAT